MREPGHAGQRIAITGATGFLGRHLHQELQQRGHDCVAIVRPDSPRIDALLPGSAAVAASLHDQRALEDALDGADCVVYCAGSVRGITAEDFRAANIDGVENIIAAATRMRRRRLLLISSLAATRPELSPYAASKKAGETIALDSNEIETVILRPPAIYGPGDREMRPLLHGIRRGLATIVGPAEQRLSLLFVSDLARAVAAALEHFDALAGGIFAIDDGASRGYGWDDIIAASRGRVPVLRLRIPRPLLHGLAVCNERLAAVLGYAPMLTRGKVCELSESEWLCNNQAFSESTGWQPSFDLRQGVVSTFERT